MKKTGKRLLLFWAVMLLIGTVMSVTAVAVDPTEEPGTKMIDCSACEGTGLCMDCYGQDPDCESCGGTGVCPVCDGTGYVESPSRVYNTVWSLLPPVIAIVLALVTKEVYSSLFICVLVGGLLYANFSIVDASVHVFNDGVVAVLSDTTNVGILVFLVILGCMVCLMNKAGGSAAFGRWAQTHIHSRVGAQLATILLSGMIFVDDYFICLTVGSVMRPITDKHNISRAKLAYLIDATAAPICILAPISSWVAAVSAFAEDGQGLNLFIHSIPFNFYAILTIFMIIFITLMRMEYGPMERFEKNARENGDIFSGSNPYAAVEAEGDDQKGTVLDLVIPVAALMVFCVTGMIYSGGFFTVGSGTYHNFIQAFSGSDASVGLMLGSSFALIVTLIYYSLRRIMSFRDMMDCLPEGFKVMVPAIVILIFAWSLKAMTDSLGAKYFVRDFVQNHATNMQALLPAVVYLISCLLAFSTGSSWGTFGMLIPIVQSVLPASNPLSIVCVSACLAGAVCGDHCSPIADSTIMASAGAQCDHMNHVMTQLPYAGTVAVVSVFGFVVAGFFPTPFIALPVAIGMMAVTLLVIHQISKRKMA